MQLKRFTLNDVIGQTANSAKLMTLVDIEDTLQYSGSAERLYKSIQYHSSERTAYNGVWPPFIQDRAVIASSFGKVVVDSEHILEEGVPLASTDWRSRPRT